MNKKVLFFMLICLLAALLLWQFAAVRVISRFESLDREIAAAGRTMEEVALLEREYAEGLEDASELDLVLRERRKDYTPLSFLERLSESAGVKYELIYREPRPIRDREDFLEASVRVELYEIDIRGLVEYLYEIENSGEFLRVRNFYIRPHGGLLRAGFEVATIVPA